MTTTVTDLLADIEPVVRGWIAEQIGDNAASNNPGDQFEFEFANLTDGDMLYYDGTAYEWKNTSIITVDDTNSRIGIGIAEPQTKLHIVDTVNTTIGVGSAGQLFTFDNYGTGDNYYMNSVKDSNAGDPGILLLVQGVGGWLIGLDNSDSDTLKFSSTWDDLAGGAKVTFTTGGNIAVTGTVDGVDIAGANAAQFVTLAVSANHANERVLTGTANQITVTDGGAGSTVTLSIPSALTIPGTLDGSYTNTVAAGDSMIDVHIIQSDDTALTGTLRGAYITASNGDEVATGTIRGIEVKARAGYPGETGANVNVLEGVSISSDAKTYDVTTHRGMEVILDGGAGTSTLAVGIRIANNFQADRATTSYALEIYRDSFDYTADIYLSSGGTIGGASGHIRIDSNGYIITPLTIDGSADVVQLTVQAHSTQTANLFVIEKSDGTDYSGADERGILFSHGGIDVNSVYIGSDAGNIGHTNAIYNIGIGTSSLAALTTGDSNLAIGYLAGDAISSGADNVLLGRQSGTGITQGSGNFALGTTALQACTIGNHNLAIGVTSLTALVSGSYNIAIGSDAAGQAVMTGAGYNIAIGRQTLYSATSAAYAIAIGFQAGYNTSTAADVVFIGRQAGLANSSAGGNIGIGFYALRDNATGTGNTVVGYAAGQSAGGSSCSNNTFVGYQVGKVITTGGNNLILSYQAGYLLTTGSSNIFLGCQAGYRQTTLSNLLIVDNQVRANVATELTNSILYGVMAAAPANQTLRINAAVTTDGVIRTVTSLYRRYYHLSVGGFDPGASGATWTDPDANHTGGWQLNAAGEVLIAGTDVHADWDEASDITAVIYFALNAAGDPNDTVDLKMICYYNGVGDTATKTQTVEVSTITDGTQFKVYKADFTINYDEIDNVVDAGDNITFVLNLETDTSEIDDVIILHGGFYYNTTHAGIESGDV